MSRTTRMVHNKKETDMRDCKIKIHAIMLNSGVINTMTSIAPDATNDDLKRMQEALSNIGEFGMLMKDEESETK